MASFHLQIEPLKITIAPGATSTIRVSLAVSGGFASPVGVTIGTLPPGVTVSRSAFHLGPGTVQEVTFHASHQVIDGEGSIEIRAQAGNQTDIGALSFSLSRPRRPPRSVDAAGFLPTRTRFIRTDGATSYFTFGNKYWTTYSASTKRFFSADPLINRVSVLSAAQGLIASIPVPGALSVDASSDGTVVYVGSLLGDVYVIDAWTLQITRRYIASQIGPYGYITNTVVALADGRLGLLGALGPLQGVNGSPSFAIWNPGTNSIQIYTSQYGAASNLFGGPPQTIICGGLMGNFGQFARSPDRTKIVVASAFSDNTLCKLDVMTGIVDYRVPLGISRNFAISPDGTKIATVGGGGVGMPTAYVYNFNTLEPITNFPVQGDTSFASSLSFGNDPNTLFVPDSQFVYAYEASSGAVKGWFPNVFITNHRGGQGFGPVTSPPLNVIDETGLFAGPVSEGVVLLDSSNLRAGPTGTRFTNGYLTPNTGSMAGGTQLSMPANPAGGLNSVYLGSRAVTTFTLTGTSINFTAPPVAPGKTSADLYLFANDGAMQLVPEAYAYGPVVLQIEADTVTTEGGMAWVFGYGLGPQGSGAVPPGLQISVGGKSATVIGYNSNVYEVSSQPFPMVSALINVPPGEVGPADLTVTTPVGSTTLPGAVYYLPAATQVPLPGASLAQGVYDPYNDLYYFTDRNSVLIFSRKTLTSKAIPVSGSQRLWGIAISPDGNKVAVSDLTARAIYLLNPKTLATVSTFLLPQGVNNLDANAPAALAITDQGIIYYGTTGDYAFRKLNTNTGVFKTYDIRSPQFATSFLRPGVSRDGTRIYFNQGGQLYQADAATDTLSFTPIGPSCCYGDNDLSLSSNNLTLWATGYSYDADLNARAWTGYNYREFSQISFLYGVKASPDGNVVFQPMVSAFDLTKAGIDIIDARDGALRHRISLSFPLTLTLDPLVSNGKDNVFVAITGQAGDGLAIIDLNSIPLPDPVSYRAGTDEPQTQHQFEGIQVPTSRPTRLSHGVRKPTRIPHVVRDPLTNQPIIQ